MFRRLAFTAVVLGLGVPALPHLLPEEGASVPGLPVSQKTIDAITSIHDGGLINRQDQDEPEPAPGHRFAGPLAEVLPLTISGVRLEQTGTKEITITAGDRSTQFAEQLYRAALTAYGDQTDYRIVWERR